MRALFVQQDHVSPVGPVGARFRDRGYDVEELLVVPAERFHDPGVHLAFPDPREYDVVVPMGAPWSVYDQTSIGTWIGDELAFLRAAYDAGVPVLGICFGAQALAAALGGSVQQASEAEIGWYEVESDAPELVETGPWFEWHHDCFTPPPGAHVLARTAVCPQAFTVGRGMGVQFHPELDLAMLRGWLANGGSAHLAAHGVDEARVLARTVREEPAAVARAARLVDRFLDQVAVRPPAGATVTAS